MSEETKTTNDAKPIESWAVVELMGHVTLSGRVTEENHFGSVLGRIDLPCKDGDFKTQFFHGNSIYRLTPCTEEVARAVAVSHDASPVFLWGLQQPALPKGPSERGDYDREQGIPGDEPPSDDDNEDDDTDEE